MPPSNQNRTKRSKLPPKGWIKAKRVSSYKAPPPSLLRRMSRIFINGWTVSLALLVILGGFLTLTYFWFEFSDRIDRRMMGREVFTPFAGIYSAPKTLRVNEELTRSGLIEYLRSAGYIDKNIKAEHSRGRYTVTDTGVAIEPGLTAIVDGEKIFPTLDVSFGKTGKQVTKIVDPTTGAELERANLEPKQLSTIAAEGDGRRKTVGFNDLPSHLIDSIIVTEDRAFFDHYGVNFRGIARALWRRYEGEDASPLANQGGSSITQQLVKNLLLSREQTLERKVTEAYMSVILETRLSKQEIFTLYVNQIYLGQQSGVSIYGVGEAASAYFGKDVSQLTLPESAFLAGIIRSPNRYSPYKNPDRARERRNQVLESMLEEGKISLTQFSQAHSAGLDLKPAIPARDHKGMPYFSQYVIDELPKVVSDPEALQHLRVYTSIDPDLQQLAYDTVADRLERMEKSFKRIQPGSLNAALVAIRPKSGEIVAMVGGRNFNENQFNRATMAMRQPGSVFKPFVYAAALNSPYEGSRIFTAATVLKDEKKIFTFGRDSYSPNNYGDYFSNKEITVRDALVKSKNTVTVDIAMQVNVGRVMNLAHRAGLPRVERAYPSMALGTAEATPLQVASAYTMFANLGDRITPTPITRVTKGDGQTAIAPAAERKNVVRPDVAYIVNDILKDVVNRGTAAQLGAWGLRNVPGKTAIAGKTGTSRDGWFAGFTPEIVCVVYVGYDNNDDLGLKGSDSAMPIWADFMQAALKLHPEWNGDWTMPAGIRKAEIDVRNGSLIRELDAVEEPSTSHSPIPTPSGNEDPDLSAWKTELGTEPIKVFVTEVPAEFRRVELFLSGTVPAKAMLPVEIGEVPGGPTPEATPITETWTESAIDEGGQGGIQSNRRPIDRSGHLSVFVCPASGLRATVMCPVSESRSFARGTEPKEFCPLHSSR